MHLISLFLVFCGVTLTVLSKPYSYSYYISSPGHYQSLAVQDGAVILSGVPQLALNPSPNPSFRQGRLDPAFRQNPGFDRRFPVNPGGPGDPNFIQQPGLNPAFPQNPGLDGRFPVIPGNQLGPGFGQSGLNPNFNQYPGSFGQRYPNQDGPDFRRGSDDPDDVPNGEIDPQFNQGGRFPGNPNIPNFNNGRYNPNFIPNGAGFGPQFNRIGPNSPESRNGIQPLIPRQISRVTLHPQEIDETNSTDREEVTTQQPCTFCGVHKVNPMVSFDGNDVNPNSEPVRPKGVGSTAVPGILIPNPDSEAVESKNVGGSADSGVLIQNNLGVPGTVGIPGYIFSNPFITYYGVSSL